MDIIKKAAAALKPVSDSGITVKQGWYDKDIKKLHVTLWNLGDYADETSDDDTEVEVAAVQVNIWSQKDQIALKNRIKKLMKAEGFHFMGSNDELETDTRIFNSAMRFMAAEEVAEEESEE